MKSICRLLIPALLALAGAAAAADVDAGAAERAAWLVDRAETTTGTIHRAAATQGDVGGVRGGAAGELNAGPGGSLAVPMLLSLLVPGLGEASMGYKRGYALMALDVASWIGMKHYHDLGRQKRDEYYDYLDEHWSESTLEDAFGDLTEDLAGTFFYGVTEYTDLSLWVSREDDEREYYENAGKWDQFVFGWDDFSDPRSWSAEWWQDTDPSWTEYTQLRGQARILKDTRVSSHREIYRSMRIDSNDQFENRDKLIYVVMFTRLFSMFQVAYLNGVFSGGHPVAMQVAGHDVALIAEPRGLTATRLGVSVSY